MRVIVLAVLAIVVMLPASVTAQSQREQLNQMLEQLQKNPGDHALRERIVKLGAEVKPAPAIPDEAIRFEGRAQFAFRNAKSEDDFLAAAREYEKAVSAAPWVAGYYSDLCTIYEKAGKLEDARRNCGFSLAGLSDATQVTDIKRRIAGLEFGIEKANSPQAREAALLQKVEGAKFVDSRNRGSAGHLSYDDIFEIRAGTLYWSIQIHSLGSGNTRALSFRNHDRPGLYRDESASKYRDGASTTTSYGITCTYRIRPDGQALLKRCSNWRATDADNAIARQ